MCIGGDRDGSEYEVDSLVGIEQLPNIASIGFESMAHRVSLAPLTGLPHMQTVDPLSFLAGFTDYDALLSVPRLQRVAVCNFYPTGRSRKEYDVAVRVLSALARKGVIVDLGVQEVCGLIEMRNLELGLYGLRRLPNDAVKRNKEASSAIGYWLLKHRRWSEALEWFERLAARRSLAKGAHCNALCVFLAKHEDDGLPIDAGAARRLLDVCVREGKTDPSIFHNAAGVHLLLGEVDRALSYVKEAKSHGYDMRAVRTDSVFRPLADDPRFVALVGGCCS